jgi:two-component system sensor histidine kinase KdpD
VNPSRLASSITPPIFRQLRGGLVRQRAGYLVAVASVALITLVIGLLERNLHLGPNPMLYLIAVLVTATSLGSVPAVVMSLASFVAFDWFFVEPRFTLTVAHAEDWTALLLFLLTAIITGQLAAGQRQRAQEGELRERQVTVLYDVVKLLASAELNRALDTIAEHLLTELQLAAVVIDLSDDRGVVQAHAAAGDRSIVEGARAALVVSSARPAGDAIVTTASPALGRDGPHAVSVVAMGRPCGTLLAVPTRGSAPLTLVDRRLLAAIAAQLGAAVERARLRHGATQAEILRGADELKSALLRAVSHDLRTPLASIIAYAGSLRQTDVEWTEAERIEFAQAIEQEAQRLNRLVGNLLDMSRMQAGSLEPDKGWYDLGALVDDVLGRLRPMTAQHPITVEVPDDLPPVPLDYVEIDQVVSNLIENAVKYTPPRTPVLIAARLVDHLVELTVADRGPGVPPADLPHLFEPFYRGGQPEARARGTGIGLAVARGLVEAHGGQIHAASRPGGGVCFTFTLPLTADDVLADP